MPEDREYRLAVSALLEGPQDRYLMLQRSDSSRRFAGLWQMPGGKPDPGETADRALRRELREETGLAVQVTGLAGSVEFPLPGFHVAMLVFHCRTQDSDVTLSEEHMAYRWIQPDALAKLALTDHDRRFLTQVFGLQKPR
jgi:8-oxo-dGTP diphosphatase